MWPAFKRQLNVHTVVWNHNFPTYIPINICYSTFIVGGIQLNHGCKDGFQKWKTIPTSIKQAHLYYTISLLIRFSHEREIVNIIHFPASAVQDSSTHEYFIDEFPSKHNTDMYNITRCYTYELPERAQLRKKPRQCINELVLCPIILRISDLYPIRFAQSSSS
jgi:hypothetical protein